MKRVTIQTIIDCVLSFWRLGNLLSEIGTGQSNLWFWNVAGLNQFKPV